jgi:DNA-binding Xre family transcriptional regulator
MDLPPNQQPGRTRERAAMSTKAPDTIRLAGCSVRILGGSTPFDAKTARPCVRCGDKTNSDEIRDLGRGLECAGCGRDYEPLPGWFGDLGCVIRDMRLARGWTQTDLSERLGISQPNVSQWENPDYGQFTLKTLHRLAIVFGVDLVVEFSPYQDDDDMNAGGVAWR